MALWAGNFAAPPMRDTLAVRSAASLLASIMHELLQNSPPSVNLVRREICVTTGLLPSRFSAGKATELFLKGTEPQQDSASWFSDEGKLLLPGEYAAWCSSDDNNLGAAIVPELCLFVSSTTFCTRSTLSFSQGWMNDTLSLVIALGNSKFLLELAQHSLAGRAVRLARDLLNLSFQLAESNR
jgi:hypothetical protein